MALIDTAELKFGPTIVSVVLAVFFAAQWLAYVDATHRSASAP